MSTLTYVHNFFFGDIEKIGIKKVSSDEIVSIMNKLSTETKTSPHAEKLGHILSPQPTSHETQKKEKSLTISST